MGRRKRWDKGEEGDQKEGKRGKRNKGAGFGRREKIVMLLTGTTEKEGEVVRDGTGGEGEPKGRRKRRREKKQKKERRREGGKKLGKW